MTISVITPTCFRPKYFKEMCDSLIVTTLGYDIEHIAVVDEDEETLDLARKYCQKVDYSAKKRGALYGWNRGLQMSTGDIIVPSGDDHFYHEKWLDYALDSHHEKLNDYGVVGMNDMAYGENQVATMFLFDRTYCKEIMGGIFGPPVYEYLCIDLEWNEKAKMTGHFYRDMRAIVEHRHSAHHKRPLDDHDREKMKGMSDRDMNVYLSRKARRFPIEWDSLI